MAAPWLSQKPVTATSQPMEFPDLHQLGTLALPIARWRRVIEGGLGLIHIGDADQAPVEAEFGLLQLPATGLFLRNGGTQIVGRGAHLEPYGVCPMNM